MEARAVPVAARRVNDITLIGNDFGRTLDPVVHLALEDDPELGALGVEVPFVGILRRRQFGRFAEDDVGDGAVVGDEPVLLLGSVGYFVEVQLRAIPLIPGAARGDGRLDPIDAIDDGRLYIGGVHQAGARDIDFKTQGRLVSHCLHRIKSAIRDLH